ncbi:voltage-dependent calcium channel subunit alpha-2/delta-2-like [Ptychodera flava]|uniref:voltage-dependent calcium channel subunit alpha-2/delta-2-like n=1 Tax=Ptychodera flava TaxID=63121 RepID=UPI00396A0B5F
MYQLVFKMAKLSTYVFVVLGLLVGVTALQHPSPSVMIEWANSIGNLLKESLDNVTGMQYLIKKYEDENIELNAVKGDTIVAEIATNWEKLLGLKMGALKNLVNHLEDAAKDYDYDPDILPEDVEYHDAKDLDLNVSNSTQFGQAVNMSASVVHIPTDIYTGDPRILNGIKWTSGLDEVYVDNYENDKELIWQYFGSSEGFMRTYPAYVNSDTRVDTFDHRTRTWYIQAAASSKDMMILIDVSGSVHGLVLELIKTSATSLIDTLGENDFVNVVAFNSDAWFVSCFETFVQASERNKNVLKESIRELTDKGIANYHAGFTFAFEEFAAFVETESYNLKNQGASCNKVIMLLTDGGQEDAASVFKKYNVVPDPTRVFTYVVGPQVTSTDGVKSMACENQGYFTRIPAVGAIRLNTLNYVKVLSRPMALNRAEDYQWSNIYLDAMGLGMMTTVTLPVYNRSSDDNQQMLGVTGTDVTIADMERLIPHYKHASDSNTKTLGPASYAFGINSNGYILIHPRLKGQLGYLIEPPNVDFLEVELHAPKKYELRKDMIDKKFGCIEIETPQRNGFGVGVKERYVYMVNMTYCYKFIENTSFSMAIALPSFNLHYMQIHKSNFEDERSSSLLNPENSRILIAPWQFCGGLYKNGTEEDEIIETVKDFLATPGAPVPEGCDEEMLKRLQFDLQATADLEDDVWSSKIHDSNNVLDFELLLVGTVGGLTRIFPATESTESASETLTDPWEQEYYERSLYEKEYLISTSCNNAKFRRNYNCTTLMRASKSITLEKEVKPAVLAAFFQRESFNAEWLGITTQCFGGTCSRSCEDEDLNCYLLDNGGFLVASDQEEHEQYIGSFFGIIEGDIMNDMLNKSIFGKVESYDYQASCPKLEENTETAAGARSINVPSLSLPEALTLNWWASKATWGFLQYSLYNILFSPWSSTTVTAQEETEENVSCIKLEKQFYLSSYIEQPNNELICASNCSREWSVRKVPHTNMLLVVVEADCPECPHIIVDQEPERDILSK